jgi:HEAT repeat protein
MSVGAQPFDTSNAVRPSELVQRLRELDEELPDAFYAQLLAAGAAIVPELLAVLEDALVNEPVAYGWAPVHAVRLLGVLGDARAVPGLLRGLERWDQLDPFAQQITDALLTLGLCAIDGCLEVYATTNDNTRDSLAFVLGRCETHDERIYAVLLDTLERSPELGANCLVDYGDPRALAALSQRFDALPIREEGSPVDNHVFVELRCAIEDLGGHLTAEQADAPRHRAVIRRRRPPPLIAVRSPESCVN